jgi:hypothetical protein
VCGRGGGRRSGVAALGSRRDLDARRTRLVEDLAAARTERIGELIGRARMLGLTLPAEAAETT